jgi:hypothetical protein
MTKVKNLNGTSDKSCICGNWISHWVNYAQHNGVLMCSVIDCISNDDVVGAHVKKMNTDLKHYIIPLCQSHNKSNSILEVGNVRFVSANTSETCRK